MDLLNINLNLLKSFWAVYKTGGINKGAKFLGVATPVVAYNIKQLERQLDKKLFITHKKGVDPTGDATLIYPLVENIFENLQKCGEQLKSVSSGTIRIGLSFLNMSFLLAKFLQWFRKKYPDINFEFLHHQRHDHLEMLENNQADVAIYSPAIAKPTEQMYSFELHKHPMVFFTSKKFADEHGINGEITLEQLSTLPLLIFGMMKTRSVLEILENFYGTKLNAVETSSTLAAFDMTMNGQGICYFFEEYLDSRDNDQILKLKVTDAPAPPARVYNCAYDKKPSALVNLFIKELKEFYKI